MLERRPDLAMAMIQHTPVWISTRGTTITVVTKFMKWARIFPIRGDCTIRLAISGSGVKIGMDLIPEGAKLIRKVLRRVLGTS